MAAVRPTLLDIAKANGSDGAVGLIEETSAIHPEITRGEARTIKGVGYKTLVRVRLPTVGFRDANQGTDAARGAYENRYVETFIFDPRWECDKAVADRYEDGAEAFIALEASAITEASMQHLSRVFYYGRNAVYGDPKGFPGLLAAYDATNMVVDAGGTTAGTGSSVWAVKFGPKDVQWVWGNNGALEMPDVRTETLYDAQNKPFTGYVGNMLAYPGLQVGSTRSIARIKKLTADADKGLTDDRLAELLAKFPAGVRPDVLFMTRRSLEQLRKSRKATNEKGEPAPTPTNYAGIPIEVTDAISDAESLTL